MDYSELLEHLKKASAFDLFRIRESINRTLDDPGWVSAVQARLRVGQNIEYFEPSENASRTATILEFRRRYVLVREESGGRHWYISYAAINLDGADVRIRERPMKGLGRNEIAIGDRVGFLSRDNREISGRVVRLNEKTVTVAIEADGAKWRVSYGLLHRVVDSDATIVDGVEVLRHFPGRS